MPCSCLIVIGWHDNSLSENQVVASRNRIFGYDALKALAAFFVVLYHVGMVDLGYRDGEYYYPTIVQVLWLFCACGVPLFFMVNGALTVSRNYDLKKSATKAGRLLLAGIFWGLVVMCLYALKNHDTSSFNFGMVHYYWFLFSLALMYLLNYLMGRLPRVCRWVVVSILLVFPFLTNLIWDAIILCYPAIEMPKWGHIGAFTLYGLVYLYAGDFLAHHSVKRVVVIASAVLGLALLALEATAVVNYRHAQFEGGNYCFPTLGALLLSIAVFVWVKEWNLKDSMIKKSIVFLGDNALGIYIFHLILMIIVGMLFPHLGDITVNPLVAVLIAAAYMVASAMISEVIRRSPLGFLLKL